MSCLTHECKESLETNRNLQNVIFNQLNDKFTLICRQSLTFNLKNHITNKTKKFLF